MPKRKRKVNRRHTTMAKSEIRDAHVYRLVCTCCGEVTVIKGSNMRRLAEGAQAAGVKVEFDMSMLPAADWAADVPDETIALAVRQLGVPQ